MYEAHRFGEANPQWVPWLSWNTWYDHRMETKDLAISSRCSCELPKPCGQGLLDILGARSTKGPLTVNSSFSANFWDDEISNRINRHCWQLRSCTSWWYSNFPAILYQSESPNPESYDFFCFAKICLHWFVGKFRRTTFFTSLWRAIEGTLGQFCLPWCGPLPSSSIESIVYHLVPVIIKTS